MNTDFMSLPEKMFNFVILYVSLGSQISVSCINLLCFFLELYNCKLQNLQSNFYRNFSTFWYNIQHSSRVLEETTTHIMGGALRGRSSGPTSWSYDLQRQRQIPSNRQQNVILDKCDSLCCYCYLLRNFNFTNSKMHTSITL